MDFRIEQRFAAPVEAVEAALLDPAFIERLSNLPKIGKTELLAQDVDAAVAEQEMRYLFRGNLSPAVRAVVDPKKLSWILESRFDRSTHESTWRILPDHYGDRLTAHGHARLIEDGMGTKRITNGVVEVHIALVGGRVERAIVSGLKEHADAEAAELGRFLAERIG